MNRSNTKLHIKGKIASGKGKGAYFISQKQYKKQFKEQLGDFPFHGTLNITVQTDETRSLLNKIKGVTINGFQTEKKKFGNVKCIKGTIKKEQETQNIIIIIPEKSGYTDTLEIIAPINLRKELKLNNGDNVEIIVRM